MLADTVRDVEVNIWKERDDLRDGDTPGKRMPAGLSISTE